MDNCCVQPAQRKNIAANLTKKIPWQKGRFVQQGEIMAKNVQMDFFCAIITPTGAAGKGGEPAAGGEKRPGGNLGGKRDEG